MIREACIHAVLTRSVGDLVKAPGMTGVSKSQVSRTCEEIEERVDAFLNRPIEGGWRSPSDLNRWRHDGSPRDRLEPQVKVRQNGRIVSVAVSIAVGVNSDGRREVPGMDIGPSEAFGRWPSSFRTEFLRKRARRGLRELMLVVSDAHEGLVAAISKALCATRQRCRIHFMRNALATPARAGAGLSQPSWPPPSPRRMPSPPASNGAAPRTGSAHGPEARCPDG